MQEKPTNYESSDTGSEANTTNILSDMPSYKEHMDNMEKQGKPIDEKYYQQATEEKDSWIEIARNELEKAQNLQPEDKKRLLNPEIFWGQGKEKGFQYRPLDRNNAEDMALFDEYKSNAIKQAKDRLKEEEAEDLDKLAECFRNQDFINQIAIKLENNEDFTEEEQNFLGDAPTDMNTTFDVFRFLTPKTYWGIKHSLLFGFTYNELFEDQDNPETDISELPVWTTIAQAQMREMIRKDQALLFDNEDVHNSLEDLEKGRDSFYGETNLNSETGKARTFTPEDNYPRFENESDEDYKNRLKRIRLKTRFTEKQQ